MCCCLQTEAFYDFADENGLLIWQDAMFGGSHYPRTPEWLTNYAEEVSQQVCAPHSSLQRDGMLVTPVLRLQGSFGA